MVERCLSCGKGHDGTFGSGSYCSRTCANRRTHSDDTKNAIRDSLRGHERYSISLYTKICVTCSSTFQVEARRRHVQNCSIACRKLRQQAIGRERGLATAASMPRRSANEIKFAELCSIEFNDILTNEPMFDGWDADVIIPSLKVAVLWNGVWHYKQVTSKHSLPQVQNRDRIKADQIAKAGYKLYIIKDEGTANEAFVKTEYDKFKLWIGELAITRPS